MRNITLHIARTEGQTTAYEVTAEQTLLAALYEIKQTRDATLTFYAGCRSGVCGTCAVRVNGREVLACAHEVCDGDIVEPLRYHPHTRDLRVDRKSAHHTLQASQAHRHGYRPVLLTPDDEHRSERQSDCILCDSCYSACPVFAANPDFLGPFALTRAYRYVVDRRQESPRSIIDAVQQNGVWDCTLCGECTAVCPKGIDPKMDITMLRAESVKAGYSDPNFAQPSFGGPDFSGGFGFDPNAGV